MAGYLFTFSDEDSLFKAIERGSYSTLMNPKWNISVASTLGDYATMRPGDNVYFFSKRTIYGIGEIVEITEGVSAFENYEGASLDAKIDYAIIKHSSIVDDSIVNIKDRNGKLKKRVKRWAIVFKPAPFFFLRGVDMDDMLMSNVRAFRSLRIFEKRSFIKLDDEENQAFKAAILQQNIEAIYGPNSSNILACNYNATLKTYRERIGKRNVRLNIPAMLEKSRKKDGSLSNEMNLEVGLLYQLSKNYPETVKVFGTWDYLSHQVAASPMKPILWLDKIDIFAYRYITGFSPTIETYGVIELKKDTVTGSDIHQVMKYVDWINQEYGTGDYALISAFLVGFDFDIDSITKLSDAYERRYTIGHPAHSEEWRDLHFIKYKVDETGCIIFETVIINEDGNSPSD